MTSESTPFLLFPPGTDPSLPGPRAMALLVPAAPSADDNPEQPEPPQQTLAYVYPLLREGKFVLQWRNLPCMADAMTRDRLVLDGALPMCTRMPPTAEPYHPDRDTGFFFIDTEGNQQDVAELLRGVLPAPLDPLDAEAAAVVERFAFGDIPISGAPANGFMWPERKSTPAYFALLRVAEQRPPLPGDEYLVDDMPQPPPPAPPVNPASGGEAAATRKRAHESEDGGENDEERAVKRARTSQEPVPMNSTRAALPGEPTARGNAGIIPRHALPGARGAINDEVPIPMDVTTTSTADETPALAACRAPLPRDPHGAADGALRTLAATPPVQLQVDLTHATHATPPAPPRSGTGAHVPRNVVARVGPPPPPAPPDLALPGLLGPGGFRGVPQTPNPFMFADDDASPAPPAPPRLILPPSARIPLAAPPAPTVGQPLAPAPTAPGAPLMPTLAAGSLPADALPSVSKASTPLPAKSTATAATAAPGTPPRSAPPPAASSPLTTTPVTTPAVPQWNIPQVTPQTEQQPTSPLFSEEPSSPTAPPTRPLPAGTPPSQPTPASPARHVSPVKNTPPRLLSLEGLTPATTLKPATPAPTAPAAASQASQPRSTPSTPARSARSPSRTPAPTTKEEPSAPRPPSPAPVAAPPPVPSGRGIPECVMEPPSLTERPPSPGQRSVSSGGTRGRGPGRSKKAPAVPSLEEEGFAFLKELQNARAAGLPLAPLIAPMEGVVATTSTATTVPSAPIAAAAAPRLKTVSGTTEEEPQDEERNDHELEDSPRPGRKKAAAKKGAKKAAAKKASAKKAAARKINASEESAEEPVQQLPPSPSAQQDSASSAAPPAPPPLQAATPPRPATPPTAASAAASAAASSAEKGKSGEGESASTPAATPVQPKRRGRPKGWKKPTPATSEPAETPVPRPPTPPASPPLPASSSDAPAAATPVVKRKGRPPKNRPAETPVPDLPALASPVVASNESPAPTTEPVAKAQPTAKATPAAKATLGYKSTPAAKETPAKSSPAAKSAPVTVVPRKTSALVEADLPAAPAPVRKKPGPKPKPKPDNQPAEVTMIDRAAKQAANQVFGAKAPEVSPPRKKAAAAAAAASPEKLPAGKGKASAKGKGKAKAKAVPTDEPVTALPLSVLRRSEPPASRRREPSQTPMPTGESEGEEEGERSSGQEQRPGTSNDEQETDTYPESTAAPMQVDSGTPAPSEQSSPQRKTVPFTPGSLWLPGSPALEYTLRNSLAAGQLEGGDESHLETMEGVVRGGGGYQPTADEEMPQAPPLITTTTTDNDQHNANESAPPRTLERTERSPSAHGSGLTPGLSGQAATPAYSDPGRATTVVNTPATPEGALGLHDKSSQPSQPSQQSLTASGSVLLAGLKSPHLAGTERTLNEHSLNPRPASPFIVGAAVTTATTTAALSPTTVAVAGKSLLEPSQEPVPAPARMRSPPPPHSAPLPARPTPRSPTTAVPATPPFEVTVQGEVRSPGGRVLATPANPGHSPPSHVMHAAYPPAQSPYRPQNFGAPFDFSDVGPFEGESHEDFMAMLFRSAQSPGQGAFYERNLPPRPSSAGAIPSPATHDDALRMEDPRQVAPNYYGLSNTPLLPLHGLSTPMLPPTPARSPSLMPHTPAPSMHPELTVAFAPHAAPLRPPSGLLTGVHEMAESFVAQDATRRTAGVSPVTVQQPQPTYPLSVPQSSPRPPPVVSAIGLNHSPAPPLVAPTPPPPPPMASEPPSELPLPPVFAGAQELEPTAAATMMATDTDTPESLESGVPVSARDSLSPPLAVAQPNHQPFRWRGVADVPGSPTLVPRPPTAAPAPPAAPLAESVVASETAAAAAANATTLGETGTRKRPHSPEPSDQSTAAAAEGPAIPSDQAPPSKRVPPATLAPSPSRSVVNNRASRDVFGVLHDASCQLINTFFNLPADSPQRLRVYTPVSADDLARGALPGDGNSFFACMHIAIIGGHQAMGWGVQAARHHVIHERSGDMKKELSEMKALLEKDKVDSHRVVREFFLNDPETRQAIDQYKAGGPVNDAHLGRSRRFEDWIRSEGPPEVDEFLVSQTESAYKTNCIILDVTNIKRVEGALKLTVAYRNDLSMFDVRKDPLGMNLFLLHGPVDYNNPTGPQIYRVVTCPSLRAMEQDEPMTGPAAASRSDAGEGEAGEEWVRFLPRDLPSGLANDLRSGSLGRTVVLPLDQV